MTVAQENGNYELVHSLCHGLYFESAAMILTLITVGKLLEAYSKGKTTNAIKELMELAPKTAIVIRDGKASFDILSAPTLSNQFDKNHIKITNLNADIILPQLKNDDFIINVKRLNVKEKSGIDLKKLQGNFHIASTGISIDDLEVFVGDSKFFFADLNLDFNDWNGLSNKIKTVPLDITLKKCSFRLTLPQIFAK